MRSPSKNNTCVVDVLGTQILAVYRDILTGLRTRGFQIPKHFATSLNIACLNILGKVKQLTTPCKNSEIN